MYELWFQNKGDEEWYLLDFSNNIISIENTLRYNLKINLKSVYPKAKYKICKEGEYWWKNY